MSSRARRCGGCGGPLSEAADDRGTITCSFCGMVNEVSAPKPTAQPIVLKVDSVGPIVRVGSAVAVVVGSGNFQSLSRREDVPRVRARDAAVYPWK